MSLEDFEMVHDLDSLYQYARQYVKALECDMDCQHMLTGKGMYEEQLKWIRHIWLTVCVYREALSRAKENSDVSTQQPETTQKPGCDGDAYIQVPLPAPGDY